MADQISSAVQFWVDNSSGTLTNISTHVTNVDLSGGNELIDNTGLSDSRKHEILGLTPVGEMSVAYKINSTTKGIFTPLLNGTSVQKTVQVRLYTGAYVYGEANVGSVGHSLPIGLLTGSATFRAADNNGIFRVTSVAQV